MVFSSFFFLFHFLPVVLGLHFLAPRRLRNLVLVLASLFFYTWGEPRFVLTLLALCAVDFVAARAIEAAPPARARLYLTLSVGVSVCALAYYKYANFFAGEASRLLVFLGEPPLAWQRLLLPIGISFFTFHKISYVVDVYRGVRPAARSPLDFLLYILFFPQLIAGPIIRYHEIERQLRGPRPVRLDDLFEGAARFAVGLAKKVLVADVVGHTADNAFELSAGSLSTAQAWLGIVAYTAQIYYDFAGYSDMAIGLARIFGFRFPENFDRPYLARSFTDFWRRWHTSFGRWMREYLYFPLGGSKRGPLRTYVNLWIVFLFSGLWHGAQWTFVLWGAWHGFFMTLERLFLLRWTERLPVAVQTLVTLFLVMLSRVLFRAEDLGHALRYFHRLATSEGHVTVVPMGSVTSPHEIFVIVLAYALCLWPLVPGLEERLAGGWSAAPPAARVAARGFATCALVFLSVTALAGSDFSPFIYFQF